MTTDIAKPITLAELAAGGTGERFDHTFTEVLDNALDINRPAEKVRKIVLTISIAPIDSDTGVRRAGMSIEVDKKIQPLKPISMPIHFGRDAETGNPVAILVDPEQLPMFKQDELTGVVPISHTRDREGGE